MRSHFIKKFSIHLKNTCQRSKETANRMKEIFGSCTPDRVYKDLIQEVKYLNTKKADNLIRKQA